METWCEAVRPKLSVRGDASWDRSAVGGDRSERRLQLPRHLRGHRRFHPFRALQPRRVGAGNDAAERLRPRGKHLVRRAACAVANLRGNHLRPRPEGTRRYRSDTPGSEAGAYLLRSEHIVALLHCGVQRRVG